MTFKELLEELELTNNYNCSEEKGKTISNFNYYLTLILNKEIYAISIYEVEELIQLENIIVTCNDNNYKKGLIKYNGSFIEVIDLRLRLNIQPKSYDYQSTVIVANINNNLIGLIIDDVIDIEYFSYIDNRLPKNLVHECNKELCVKEIIYKDDEIKKVLDLKKILNFDESSSILELMNT